jgi:hypothetical protein
MDLEEAAEELGQGPAILLIGDVYEAIVGRSIEQRNEYVGQLLAQG